jgi:hypothetical protein
MIAILIVIKRAIRTNTILPTMCIHTYIAGVGLDVEDGDGIRTHH